MELPIELIDKIITYLDIKDCIEFLTTNKNNLKVLQQPFFWKKRLMIDYNYICNYPRKPFNYTELLASKYIRLYDTLCVSCLKKTSCIHPFYKKLVCRKCEISNTTYRTICQSYIFKNFLLNKNDLKCVKFHTRSNMLNSKRPVKLYLLSDINKITCKKYPNDSLEIVKKNKIKTMIDKCMMYSLKYSMLELLIKNSYNITISIYSEIINNYSNGIFRKYMRNIRNTKTKTEIYNLQIVINCYKELEFILSYQQFSYDFTYHYFDEYLENMILLSDIPIESFVEKFNHCNYISTKIFNILDGDKYARKIRITKFLNNVNTDFSSVSTSIYNYIYKNDGELDDINYELLEKQFLIENFTYTDILVKYLYGKEEKIEIIKNNLIQFQNGGKIIPEFIKQKYAI